MVLYEPFTTPVTGALVQRKHGPFFLNILFCIRGYIPGLNHAIRLAVEREDREKEEMMVRKIAKGQTFPSGIQDAFPA